MLNHPLPLSSLSVPRPAPSLPGRPHDGDARLTLAPALLPPFLPCPCCNASLPPGHVTETHQYSVTEYAQPLDDMAQLGGVPALDLNYDLSPIIVSINEHPPSLLHFLVRICAVVGGAFAVTREYGRVEGQGADRGLCPLRLCASQHRTAPRCLRQWSCSMPVAVAACGVRTASVVAI